MSYDKQNKRIIWVLANGNKRYSCKRGIPELWSNREIDNLIKAKWNEFQRAYTPEYGLYIPDVRSALAAGMNLAVNELIYIKDYIVQSAAEPIINEYLPN